MNTKETLAAMLKENTGTHFLDSGGAYGRSWQRNAAIEFDATQATELSFRYGEISVTHNAYHWLAERLDVSEEGANLRGRRAQPKRVEARGGLRSDPGDRKTDAIARSGLA